MSDLSQPTTSTMLTRLPADRRAFYQSQLTFFEGLVTLYQTQLQSLLTSPVESYGFASGNGSSQNAKRRAITEVQRGLQWAVNQQNFYWRKLYGYNNVNFALRRR